LTLPAKQRLQEGQARGQLEKNKNGTKLTKLSNLTDDGVYETPDGRQIKRGKNRNCRNIARKGDRKKKGKKFEGLNSG